MRNRVDKKLAAIGFKKVQEDDFFVRYTKEVPEFKYTHTVDILHKASGKHILQSYDNELEDGSGIGSTCVGLTWTELRLFAKKMRELGWKS